MTDEQLADLRARISDDITAHEITRNGKMKRVQNMRDALVVLDEVVRLRKEVAKKRATEFDQADWFWRARDPDDSGYSPEEAISRSMLGEFVVCEICSSFTGPTRFGFVAPVHDPESDDEEFVHFGTEEEAIKAAKQRRTALGGAHD